MTNPFVQWIRSRQYFLIVGAAIIVLIAGCAEDTKNPVDPGPVPLVSNVIAYIKSQAGTSWLSIVKSDGTSARDLVEGPTGSMSSPSWAPDNSAIYFVRNGTSIGRYRFLDSSLSVLTGTLRMIIKPVVSPDGQRIAFYTMNRGNIAVLVFNIQTNGLDTLYEGPGYAEVSPAWLPGSQRLCFTTREGASSEIVVADINTKALTNLTQSNSADEFHQVASPNSDHIYAYSQNAGRVSFLRISTTGGSTQTLHQADVGQSVTAPIVVVSPDGGKIFASASTSQFLIVGSAVQDLSITGFRDEISSASWARDSRMIAYSAVANQPVLTLLDTQDETRSLITTDLASEVDPAWSPR